MGHGDDDGEGLGFVIGSVMMSDMRSVMGSVLVSFKGSVMRSAMGVGHEGHPNSGDVA